MPAPCSAATDYLDAARAAAAFVLDQHARRPTAGCCAPSTRARAKLGAYLEDHAFLLEALLVLYEATFEERWFVEARALADDDRRALRRPRARRLLLDRRRPRARSSPGARTSRTRRSRRAGRRAAFGLLRLAALTGEHAYEEQAAGQLRAAARDRGAPPERVRAPAAGARPLPRPAARGGPGRRPGGRGGAGRRRARGAPPAPGGRGRAGRRADRAWRSWSSARPSTAAQRPTCASASPAARRSPSPTSYGRCSRPSPGRWPG